jgi:hypothetical protein
MTVLLTIALVCYALSASVSLVFGMIYITRRRFMPYHRDAVEQEWQDVDPKHQVLLLALMRVAGGGWLAAFVSMVFLLVFPFRAGESWSLFALPAVGMTIALATFYAPLYVKRHTKAKPPVVLAGLAIVLIAAGFLLSLV